MTETNRTTLINENGHNDSSWGTYYNELLKFKGGKTTTVDEKQRTENVKLKTEKEFCHTGLNKSPFEELSEKIETLSAAIVALEKQIECLTSAYNVAIARLNAKTESLERRTEPFGWAPPFRQTSYMANDQVNVGSDYSGMTIENLKRCIEG